HALGAVVGGLDAVQVEEGEAVRSLFPETVGEAGVVGIGEVPLLGDEGVQAPLDLAAFAPEGAGGEAVSVLRELEGLSEHRVGGAGEADGAAGLLLLQLAEILQEMGETLLLRPAGELVVIEGRSTVAGEDALEV